MKKIITALANPILNNELKKQKDFIVIGNDIQYQDGVKEVLEKEKNIDFLILSEILPGENKIEKLIEDIKEMNPNINIIIILENKKEELEKYLYSKSIYYILYNKTEITEIINVIKNKKEETRVPSFSFDIDCYFLFAFVCRGLHQLTDRFCDFAVLADNHAHVVFRHMKHQIDSVAICRLLHGNVVGMIDNCTCNATQSFFQICHLTLPVAESADDIGLLQQSLYGISGLCTLSDPAFCLLGVDLDLIGLGVVETDFLDETTVSGEATVSHNHTIGRSLLCSGSSQSHFYCHFLFPPKN